MTRQFLSTTIERPKKKILLIFKAIIVLPLDELSVDTAVNINSGLKKKRKQIDLADLFIAATAVNNRVPLATLNKKHFERIDTLRLVE